MDANKTNNILDSFKEYVLSYTNMLMGVPASGDDDTFVASMEARFRNASSFSELPILIHRLYASSARRDKTVKAVELQSNIYAELNQLCTNYMMLEAIPAMANQVVGLLGKATVPLPIIPGPDETESSDYDDSDDEESEEEIPPLMESSRISIDNARAETDAYINYRNMINQNLQKKIDEIVANRQAPIGTGRPLAQVQPSTLDSWSNKPVQTDRQRTEEEYKRIFAPQQQPAQTDRQRAEEEYKRIFGGSQQQPNKFVAAANNLEGTSANELLRMLNVINRKQ